MKKEINTNTYTWLFLVVLIIVSTIFAENHFSNAILIITALTALKFLFVIFQFVEVKHAHSFWKFLSLLFVLVYLIGIFSLK